MKAIGKIITKFFRPKGISVEEAMMQSPPTIRGKAIISAIVAVIFLGLMFLVDIDMWLWFVAATIYCLRYLFWYRSLVSKHNEVRKAHFSYTTKNNLNILFYVWIFFIITLYVFRLLGG